MSDTVGVVIGTYGEDIWKERALNAMASVVRQRRKADECVAVHAETLALARNQGAEQIGSDWLIFLDADDELDPGYIEAMLVGVGNIRRPATLGVYEDGTTDDEPVLIPKRDLEVANYIVIGAMVRRWMFLEAYGFHDHPMLEDWCLWRRLVRSGAMVGDVPDAIYRVGVHPGSRNSDLQLHARTYRQIRSEA